MDQLARTSKQIGAGIARRRKLLDLTQADLAEKVGLRQEAISKIESGNGATRLSKVLDILAVLDLEFSIGDRGRGAAKDIEDIF